MRDKLAKITSTALWCITLAFVVCYGAMTLAAIVLPVIAGEVIAATGITVDSTVYEWVAYGLVPYLFLAAGLFVLFVCFTKWFARVTRRAFDRLGDRIAGHERKD